VLEMCVGQNLRRKSGVIAIVSNGRRRSAVEKAEGSRRDRNSLGAEGQLPESLLRLLSRSQDRHTKASGKGVDLARKQKAHSASIKAKETETKAKELQNLAFLLDHGVITKEEFMTKAKAIADL